MRKDNNSADAVGKRISLPLNRLRRVVTSTLLLLPVLGLFIWAGNWQLDRADQKRAFISSFTNAEETSVLNAPVSSKEAKNMLYRRFQLRGRYLPKKQVLLDNMVSAGEVGYQVLTPFELAADLGSKTLIVNRGWVKGSSYRLELPNVKVGAEMREIRGRLSFLPSPGVRIDEPLPKAGSFEWPLPMTWPTTEQISELLGTPVLEWQLLLDLDQQEGYRRDWRPETIGPARHLGYAFQWFSFAAIALIIYVAFNLRVAKKLS
jgi:surfeit locus 1 family protein